MRRSARGGSTPRTRARTRKAAPAAAARAPSLGGRPSRQQAARLGERILDAATPLFMAHGYGATSIEARAGNLALDNPTFAARQFLYMIIALPQRRAMGFGAPMTSAEIDAWARDVVNLFLNGCRGWVRATA